MLKFGGCPLHPHRRTLFQNSEVNDSCIVVSPIFVLRPWHGLVTFYCGFANPGAVCRAVGVFSENVLVWGDADEAGNAYTERVPSTLHRLGVAKIRAVDAEALARGTRDGAKPSANRATSQRREGLARLVCAQCRAGRRLAA